MATYFKACETSGSCVSNGFAYVQAVDRIPFGVTTHYKLVPELLGYGEAMAQAFCGRPKYLLIISRFDQIIVVVDAATFEVLYNNSPVNKWVKADGTYGLTGPNGRLYLLHAPDDAVD